MIRYQISRDELNAKIKEHKSSWLKRAKQRTEKFVEQGFYSEHSTIWSEIKPVYMTLQHDKCIFCERQSDGVEIGTIEQDVEHFRPKGNIKAWHSSDSDISLSEAPEDGGYYKLPYNPFNYAASCKPCNSVLKRDYFPIAGDYQLEGDNPAAMNDVEQPYLIYPIGDIDTDPSLLIRFNGVSPYAVSNESHLKRRALVTIELFKLDDPVERKNLLKERATAIIALWAMLNSTTDEARLVLDNYRQTTSRPHTNCGRCFIELFEQDKALAESFLLNAFGYITLMWFNRSGHQLKR